MQDKAWVGAWREREEEEDGILKMLRQLWEGGTGDMHICVMCRRKENE